MEPSITVDASNFSQQVKDKEVKMLCLNIYILHTSNKLSIRLDFDRGLNSDHFIYSSSCILDLRGTHKC